MQQDSQPNVLKQDGQVAPWQVIVVIPALNEVLAIKACIRSLIEGDPFMDDVTLIVADGGSTDGTLDVLEQLADDFPNLSVQHNLRKLQSAGINSVVELSVQPEHKYLVRCDAHAVYPPSYVRDVVETLSHQPEAASVVVPMNSIGQNSFSEASAWVVGTKLGSGGSAHRGSSQSGWIDHGHHAGFRLDWFRKVGGYDETFSHNEDAEYDHRIALVGGRVWLETDVRLDYTMRPTLKSLAKQYWNYGKGRARTVLKHKMTPRLRQMIPVIHVILLVLSIGLGSISPAFWVYPAFYLAVLVGVSCFGAKRLGTRNGLWAGPALGAMHLAWGAGFIRQCLTEFRVHRNSSE